MLLKWTNAFKGWQPRWFSVDQQQGVLHYFMVCVCVWWVGQGVSNLMTEVVVSSS